MKYTIKESNILNQRSRIDFEDMHDSIVANCTILANIGERLANAQRISSAILFTDFEISCLRDAIVARIKSGEDKLNKGKTAS